MDENNGESSCTHEALSVIQQRQNGDLKSLILFAFEWETIASVIREEQLDTILIGDRLFSANFQVEEGTTQVLSSVQSIEGWSDGLHQSCITEK